MSIIPAIGSKVIFDKEKISLFIEETNSDNPELQKYQKLVMGGVDQVGTVKNHNGNLTEVSYPDGWVLPVPTKYLVTSPL